MTPPTAPGAGITSTCSDKAADPASSTDWPAIWPLLNLPPQHCRILSQTPQRLSFELLDAPESYYDRFELMASSRRPDIAVRGWIAAHPPARTEAIWLVPSYQAAGRLLRHLSGLPPHHSSDDAFR